MCFLELRQRDVLLLGPLNPTKITFSFSLGFGAKGPRKVTACWFFRFAYELGSRSGISVPFCHEIMIAQSVSVFKTRFFADLSSLVFPASRRLITVSAFESSKPLPFRTFLGHLFCSGEIVVNR